MHCSLCRQSGYNKTKYLTKPQQDEEYKKRRVETREHPMKHARKCEKKEVKPEGTSKPNSAKELRRQKIQVRRKGKEIDNSIENETELQ